MPVAGKQSGRSPKRVEVTISEDPGEIQGERQFPFSQGTLPGGGRVPRGAPVLGLALRPTPLTALSGALARLEGAPAPQPATQVTDGST